MLNSHVCRAEAGDRDYAMSASGDMARLNQRFGVIHMLKVTKAVFPVAGLGTRFLPATKASPKEMLPIVDKPLIQYAVEEAIAAGITEMIFVTGRSKRAIEDHFDKSYEIEAELEARGKQKLLELVRSIKPSRRRLLLRPPGRSARPGPRGAVRREAGRRQPVRRDSGRRPAAQHAAGDDADSSTSSTTITAR